MPESAPLPDRNASQPDLMAPLEASLSKPTWVIHLTKHTGPLSSRRETWVGVAENRDAANAAALAWVRDDGYYVSYADGPFVPVRDRDRLRAENEALRAALCNVADHPSLGSSIALWLELRRAVMSSHSCGESMSPEYHATHLAFARTEIVQAAAKGEPILDRLKAYTTDVLEAERDRLQQQDERRGAFLGGEGTLTWREVVAWSRELGYPCRGDIPIEMMPTDPMMVSVLPQNWPKKPAL